MDRNTTQNESQELMALEEDNNLGRGWHGDPERHADAGRKGGETVSQNRDHMAQIGRRGGQTVSRDREHMAQIGRRGGQQRRKVTSDKTETTNPQDK